MILPAGEEHVSAIVRLVNDAYAAGEMGLWRDGLQRTDEAEIAAAVRAREMLVAAIDGRAVGCARVRSVDPTTAEVGLITADPGSWGSGVGRAVVRAAEDRARSQGATTMRLTLLVPREGAHPFKDRLRDWYTRLGYEVVGSVALEEAMPHVAPSLAVPCDLLLFSKPL
jgi:GNAT superfamily N-acetyltransferase